LKNQSILSFIIYLLFIIYSFFYFFILFLFFILFYFFFILFKSDCVFVMGASAPEQQMICEMLLEEDVSPKSLPRRMTTEYTAQERFFFVFFSFIHVCLFFKFIHVCFFFNRTSVYESGGVHFVSHQLLLMDLLYKRILPEKINGFLVLHCDRFEFEKKITTIIIIITITIINNNNNNNIFSLSFLFLFS